MVGTDVVEHAPDEAAAPRRGTHHAFAPAHLHLRQFRRRRFTPLFAIGLLFACVVSLAFGPDIAGTQSLFVAVIRNAGNTFGVPAILAPTGVGATPQPSGGISLQWSEPGASSVSPVATSWAGTYLIYRSDSPATPAANATPFATVLSSGGAIGAFVDGGLVNGQACTGPACPANNTRYYYWVRALSRQTGFPSPFFSATVSAASDATAPQVVSVSPGGSAVAVPVGTNVQITFSEPVDFDAAVAATCIAPTSSPANCVAITGNHSRWAKSSGVLLEVKPTVRLNSNTAYGVSFIASGTYVVRDLAGNVMPATSASSFTTETPAGTVSIRWRSPAVDSQEYMPASGPIVALTFAEPMDQASTSDAFKLFAGAGCTGSAIPVTASWNASSNAVAFSPAGGTPLSVGLMASPTFGVYTYSMRFNEPTASGKSAAGFPATAISCANGTFVPSASVLGFDLADVPSGATITEPMVVAGEPLVLRSVSGPWRQGSYTTLKSSFDEPRTSNVASESLVIGGDTWSGLPISVPTDATSGRHFIGVQNDAIGANIGQDVRTAFRAVTVVDPSISVATFSAADTSETSPRTLMSPKASGDGDTVRFRVQVTAPSRDGSGVRPVAGIAVRVRAVVNPVGYGARLCAAPTTLVCTTERSDLSLTTDSQGVIRGYMTAPQAGAPFNTIVLLASAGTEWGSVVLTDPAPTPPADLKYVPATGRFSWSASPTPGVAGYRVRLIPVGVPGAVDIVIDAGAQLSIGIPEGALVANRPYRVSVIAYDDAGRTSSSSSEIDFVAPSPTPTATPTATAVATATSSATFAVTATVIATPATVVSTPSAATGTPIAALPSATTSVTPVPSSVGGSVAGPTPVSSADIATSTATSGLAVGATSTPGTTSTSVGTPASTAIPPTATVVPQTPTSASPTAAAPTATIASTTVLVATTQAATPTAADPTQVLPTVAPSTQVPPTVVPAPTPVPSVPTTVPASTPTPVAPTTGAPAPTAAPPAPTTAPSAAVFGPDGGATW